MKLVEVVTRSGAVSYVPLKKVRRSHETYVRNSEGQIEPAVQTLELYNANQSVPVEDKKEWGDGVPFDKLYSIPKHDQLSFEGTVVTNQDY